jgi:hypothetical protein
LLPPGVDLRDDLANPGYALHAGCASYNLYLICWGSVIRVLLHKKAFKILKSPPPIEGCKSMIDAKGCLTIGWRGDVRGAWHLVLKILEEHALAQAIAQSALPEGAAANPVPVGAAANPVPKEAAANRSGLIAAGRKRKRYTAFPEEGVSAEEDIHTSLRNPEPYISIRCALANLGKDQPWLMERMRFVAPGLSNVCRPELESPEESSYASVRGFQAAQVERSTRIVPSHGRSRTHM